MDFHGGTSPLSGGQGGGRRGWVGLTVTMNSGDALVHTARLSCKLVCICVDTAVSAIGGWWYEKLEMLRVLLF